MKQGLEDVSGLLELAVEADDEETFNEAVAELDALEEKLAQLEFRRMFSGEYDSADCYLDIQAGSGGTEAQDWASMLERMYLRWAESRGFKTEIIEESEGEVAGIKSVTIKISGDYAYGWLRTETGVHRLVRKSRLTPAVVATRRSAPRLFTRKLMMISISKSIRRICASTFIAHPARAVSTLTVPNLRCVLLTSQPDRDSVPERPFPAQEQRPGHEADESEAL